MKYFKDSDPIVECVPNFSEGRNHAVIDRIKSSIESVNHVRILHTDIGYDANRTVITMAGHPDAIVEAAFHAMATASNEIDMRQHQGEHPRMGATDVCPLIPLRNISMKAVIELSLKLGEQVGRELGIPVYLYEQSARSKKRMNLSDLRKGEYESIPDKIGKQEWHPDFGPTDFNEHSGMTAIGARPILIAYNVNLHTKDVHLAKLIARRIRESGYLENGVRIKGKLEGVKAIGWYMDSYGCAQVSTNITNIEKTGIEVVYESVKEEASRLGIKVTGSELIGLIPQDILVNAGLFYSSTTFHNSTKISLIELSINKLGLNSLSSFASEDKIIEFRL
ncbi:MAG: glutamate formimidoyltransferase [Bacteroidetes bacterium]|nr:glutamate formimidoyltransferase [Bacteroidota bacterium]